MSDTDPARIDCAVLLRPDSETRAAELELVGAMAVADAVEEALGLAAQIRWPGDVMVNRRRVGRITAERQDDHVELRIEVEVARSRDELAPGEASLLTSDGVLRERGPILAELLTRLELHYGRWKSGGIDAIYDFLGARDFLRGRAVAVEGVTGQAIGIDREGRLEIDTGAERRLVESGEVSYER